MNKICNTLLFLAGLHSTTVTAGTMGSETKRWVISVSGGATWAHGGETQTFYLAPEIEKTYTASKSNKILPEGEVFIGLQKNCINNLQTQLGLAVTTTGNGTISGDIWDDADPQFNNL